MKQIPLTRGKFAIVDDEDFEFLNQWKWHYSVDIKKGNGRAANRDRKYMHRILLNPPDKQMIDHKNGNSLDNRRQNLRFCTVSQNMMNSKPPKNSKSGIKGVSWHDRSKKWLTKIKYNGKFIHIGLFDNKEIAGEFYKAASLDLFGEFAYAARCLDTSISS